MGVNRTYAVLGLGRYGLSVARELVANGADVLAVDLDEKIVNAVATELPLCKCADVGNPEVLKQLGIGEIDVVVVSMANNLEASVMTVMLCKELGVKTVIAKCANEMHQRLLKKVGADKVVVPEYESGIRLAKNMISSGMIDIIELSKEVSIVEMEVKPEWIGKSLIELNLRGAYSINVIAIRRGDELSADIDPRMQLDAEMSLVVVINTKMLRKMK